MVGISIIVPVYKVEEYLDRCVQSILNQTFEDYELILVDDGSPDRCGQMCDEWAKKDSRIGVIHKENGGLSDARNVGIESAQGEYLTFVDSDDYIHPKMLEILYTAIRTGGEKVVVGGFCRTHGEPLPNISNWKIDVYAPEELYRERIVDATIACAKLYHRDCFASLRFPVGKLHEDEFTTYQVLFSCKAIPVVDVPLYGYYCNESGITQSEWSPRRLDVLEALQQQAAFFEQHGYKQLQVYRIRDTLKYIARFMDEIEKSNNMEKYAGVRSRLKRMGRRFLLRNWRTGEFRIGRDGWLIGYFYSGIVEIHSLVMIILDKLGLRNKK